MKLTKDRGESERTSKKRVALIVICILLALLVVLVAGLTLLFQLTNITDDRGAMDGNYMSVLGDIDGIVEANPRIVDLAMLAAHGSASYNVTPDAPLSKQDEKGMLGTFAPLIKGMTYRYAKAEAVDVATLLEQGARMFQIKCTYYNGEWWGEHALLSVPLETIIKDIIHFLATTEGEIVLPQFEPTYVEKDDSLSSLSEYIATVQEDGKNLYDFVYYDDVNIFNISMSEPSTATYDAETVEHGVRIGDLRYNDVTKNGTASGAVLLLKRVDELELKNVIPGASKYDYKFFDMDSNAYHKWHSRMGSKVLFEEIAKSAEEVSANFALYKDKLRVNQTQGSITSNIADFGALIGEWSLLDFAYDHNARLINNEHFDEWLSVMPIVLVDFANSDKDNFNSRINERLHQFNEQLVADLL